MSPIQHLGMSIRTEGDQASWTEVGILNTIRTTFPSLKRICVNIEFTYGCSRQDEVIFELIRAFLAARTQVINKSSKKKQHTHAKK